MYLKLNKKVCCTELILMSSVASAGILIGSRVLALFGCFLLTLFSAHVPEKVKALDDNVWKRYRGMLKAAFSLLAVLILLGYFL